MTPRLAGVAAVCALLLAGCYSPRAMPPSRAFEREPVSVEHGLASWYGHPFHGRRTANGERYHMWDWSAAHKTLPLGTYVRVVREDTRGSVILQINDRGPYVDGRIIDLSKRGAFELDMVQRGVAPVRVERLALKPGWERRYSDHLPYRRNRQPPR
jgi:rare lipoprotein A (peptidoglycan hydrolase)